MTMIYFRSDYSLGAHPKIMQALMDTNLEHTERFLDKKQGLKSNIIRKNGESELFYIIKAVESIVKDLLIKQKLSPDHC